MRRSKSYERGWDGRSNIKRSKSRVCEIMGRIDDIMYDDITCEDLHLASVAGMDAIPCDDLTYDDLNPECVRLWDGLTI